MTEPEALQFAGRLTLLAEVLSEPMTPTRLAGYRAALDDLAFDDIAVALNDCAKTCKFFPKPVEIRLRVGALQDAREMRALRAWQDAEEAQAVAQLPAYEPPAPPPVLTPEEQAERQARIDAGWQALFAKAKALASEKAMPPAREEPSTVIQIRQWRKDRTA